MDGLNSFWDRLKAQVAASGAEQQSAEQQLAGLQGGVQGMAKGPPTSNPFEGPRTGDPAMHAKAVQYLSKGSGGDPLGPGAQRSLLRQHGQKLATQGTPVPPDVQRAMAPTDDEAAAQLDQLRRTNVQGLAGGAPDMASAELDRRAQGTQAMAAAPAPSVFGQYQPGGLTMLPKSVDDRSNDAQHSGMAADLAAAAGAGGTEGAVAAAENPGPDFMGALQGIGKGAFGAMAKTPQQRVSGNFNDYLPLKR